MAKIGWAFFSSRRRITPLSLVERGLVRDYQSYVAYCRGLEVVPLSPQEFEVEFSCLGALSTGPTKSVPPTAHSLPEPPADENLDLPPAELEAALWLAGVDEHESAPVSTTQTLTKRPKRSKQQKSK